LISKLRDDEKFRFQYHLIRGQALMGKGNYAEAITELEEGNRIYNSDTSLLNSLGYCYYQSGELQKAQKVLQASLKLNQKQPNIQKMLTYIERALKEK